MERGNRSRYNPKVAITEQTRNMLNLHINTLFYWCNHIKWAVCSEGLCVQCTSFAHRLISAWKRAYLDFTAWQYLKVYWQRHHINYHEMLKAIYSVLIRSGFIVEAGGCQDSRRYFSNAQHVTIFRLANKVSAKACFINHATLNWFHFQSLQN